jgi:hypothetical protein
MSQPDSTTLPTDPDQLARLAADVSLDLSLRQKAFEVLRPLIHRTAGRLAARFSGQQREDLLQAAEGDVWMELHTLPEGANFEGWCYGVLRHRQIDRYRKEQSQRRLTHAAGHTAPATAEDTALRTALERALPGPADLPEEDLVQVRGWPPAPRLALLSVVGLWARVPQEEWRRWVGDYRTEDPTLPEPFPPDELEACERLADRNGVIAGALQVPRNTLSVWLHRYKPRIRQLRHVRERLEP